MNDIPTSRLVLLAAPLIAAQVALMAWSLVDLYRRDRVLGGNKVLWVLLIVLVNVIGPILYLTLGRAAKDEPRDE